MSDLTKVTGPSSPLEGTSAKVIVVVLAGILVAVLKPWAGPAPPAATIASEPPRPTTQPSSDVIAHYDPSVFGVYEPAPDWELWPAGYLVSFGFAMRIDNGLKDPPPVAAASAAPGASSTPAQTARPAPTRSVADEPAWPSSITITASSHLALIGINTPLGHRVSATALRLEPDGTTTAFRVLKLPSPWPTHFTVIALDDGSGRSPRESWPAGRYRLHLRFDPGPIVRDIEIDIGDSEAPALPSSSVPPTNAAP
jgi:hypothetical protein